MKTNNPRKKITKREYYRRLRHWQFQRAKGLEEWNKKQKSRTRGSKYKKYNLAAIFHLKINDLFHIVKKHLST